VERSTDRLYQWVYYLASGLYFGAVFLRSLLLYGSDPIFPQVLGLLVLGLLLFISEPVFSRMWPGYFPLYLLLQSILVFFLLVRPGFPDFFAALLTIFSMQAMQRIQPRIWALWIGLCALVVAWLLAGEYGAQAVALALIYTAGNVFLGLYTLTMRRAQAAHAQNQALAGELQQTNQQLKAYSTQLEQLAIARERNRLARELHDSVTQTVFSMTLTTQSALLLLERDPAQASAHLERLNQLARSALGEMQVLVSELKPEKTGKEGLAAALRRHLASGRYPDSLSISLKVEGDRPLGPAEEQSLFRIAEEALNNIVKHAQTSQAHLRLHLAEPLWMEIEDQGQGFDLGQARDAAKVGLSGMQERAAEIGWNLYIRTASGAGTCIRVEKAAIREGQA
jgi:signal transduction histidine kinase